MQEWNNRVELGIKKEITLTLHISKHKSLVQLFLNLIQFIIGNVKKYYGFLKNVKQNQGKYKEEIMNKK